jgi:photosystem II stability/assembly factor-like uncharacterized protein
MAPRLYVGTCGLSVWYSDDLGATFERLWGRSGLYSESRVWALCHHPRRPDELLAGTDSGIHRLDLASHRWTQVKSPMDDMQVWSIARGRDDPGLILAGTRPAAVFRSTDDGRTWGKTEAAFPETCEAVLRPRVTKIEFDPDDPNRAWSGLEIGGVWRSRDAGLHWEAASNGLVSEDIHDVTALRDGERLLYAATNHGLHVSADDGETWRLQPLDSRAQYTRSVTPRADGAVLFLCNGDGPPGSWGRLLRSRDCGRHWEDAGLPGSVESAAWLVATNPADPELLFASTALGQYFRSTDGGESWVALPRRLAETRALAWVDVA